MSFFLHGCGYRALKLIQKALHTRPCVYSVLRVIQVRMRGFNWSGESILLDVADGAACRKWWSYFLKYMKKRQILIFYVH